MINKVKQSTQITSNFKWFPQCNACPLAEAITKKLSMKDKLQKQYIENHSKPKVSNTLKSHNYTIEIILKREYKRHE